MFCKKIAALAFLNPTIGADGYSDVERTFDYLFLQNQALFATYPKLQEFALYFQNEFLTKDANGNMTCNIFHIDDHRTNNDLEEWHKRVNRRLKDHSGGLWGFLRELQHENHKAEFEIESIELGRRLTPRDNNMIEREKNIARRKAQYIAGTMDVVTYNERLITNMAY